METLNTNKELLSTPKQLLEVYNNIPYYYYEGCREKIKRFFVVFLIAGAISLLHLCGNNAAHISATKNNYHQTLTNK